MPYTKEQLKNNEHYERVIEAARREQVATFVKEERDFVASGSNAAATQTLRMKTGEFVSIPEIEDDATQKVVIPNKTYYVTDDADKFVDKYNQKAKFRRGIAALRNLGIKATFRKVYSHYYSRVIARINA